MRQKKLFIKTLEIGKKCLGNRHPWIATNISNLASCYKSQNKIDQAESLYSEALTLYRKLLDESHPSLTEALNNLGMLYINKKNMWKQKSY
ncbi:tetratricopeptide repeat protein [Acaryochloris sp. 'Moss Beach']|uniref:tetratricopeptide repeat protein n=1 Tax=Acaryochloris sp. 'Moss Beach' TaxID=2740837 RepID=UPI0037BE3E8B